MRIFKPITPRRATHSMHSTRSCFLARIARALNAHDGLRHSASQPRKPRAPAAATGMRSATVSAKVPAKLSS
jgi:hypothetical protein